MWRATFSAGSMPRGACSWAVATHRTPTRRDSRGRSTWCRSARSTTLIPGSRCRCRVLPVQYPSANVRGVRKDWRNSGRSWDAKNATYPGLAKNFKSSGIIIPNAASPTAGQCQRLEPNAGGITVELTVEPQNEAGTPPDHPSYERPRDHVCDGVPDQSHVTTIGVV